jgi:hypothetical protein
VCRKNKSFSRSPFFGDIPDLGRIGNISLAFDPLRRASLTTVSGLYLHFRRFQSVLAVLWQFLIGVINSGFHPSFVEARLGDRRGTYNFRTKNEIFTIFRADTQ